jgi:GNAT superfamily N-acetyltransferase
MSNTIEIREGKQADIPAALDLIRELAIYEKAPNEVIVTEAEMIRDGFGPSPLFHFYVATLENEVIGIALTYIRYSTWKGPMLYLEDLVILEAHRGKGVGKLLFEKCMKRATDLNYEGMIWQVLDWNEPAIRFYDKYQSSYSGEWLNGKLTKTQIDTFFQSENV